MNQTPAQVIEGKGVEAIAEALKKRAGTVRMWKHRNVLPRSIWPELTQAFPDLTIQTLQEVEAAGKAA
jgi:hypothetical protein